MSSARVSHATIQEAADNLLALSLQRTIVVLLLGVLLDFADLSLRHIQPALRALTVRVLEAQHASAHC